MDHEALQPVAPLVSTPSASATLPAPQPPEGSRVLGTTALGWTQCPGEHTQRQSTVLGDRRAELLLGSPPCLLAVLGRGIGLSRPRFPYL